MPGLEAHTPRWAVVGVQAASTYGRVGQLRAKAFPIVPRRDLTELDGGSREIGRDTVSARLRLQHRCLNERGGEVQRAPALGSEPLPRLCVRTIAAGHCVANYGSIMVH
jgi:hypothetical protein